MARLAVAFALAACGTALAADSTVETYLKRQEAAGFSGSVLAVRHGRTVVHGGFGLADRRRRIPVTRDTVFDIGSITKVLTAATVLKLAEEGRLELDDPLTRFLAAVPEDKRSITVRSLLGHRSGLPMNPQHPFAALSRDEAVREALDLSLRSRPGARQSYSNVGYALLAAIVELASGERFEAAMRRRVFVPAGMSRTGFSGVRRWPARDVAIGYGNDIAAPRNAPDTYGVRWPLKGAGGVVSSAGDLGRWIRAVHAGRIVRRASVPLLYRLAVGPTPAGLPPRYGYSGANSLGFNADVEELPAKRTYVVVLTNANLLPRERATEVAQGVLRRLGA